MKLAQLNFNNIVQEFLDKFPEYNDHPNIKGDDYSDTAYSSFSVINSDSILNIEDGKNEKMVSDRILNNIH